MRRTVDLLAVIAASALGCLLVALWSRGSQSPSDIIPVGYDAFYHARRIMDAIALPGPGVYEFDPRINVPEGSAIVWPWAYDAVLAWIGAAVGLATGSTSFATVAWVPVIGFVASVVVTVGIARRAALGECATVSAALCFVMVPRTVYDHLYGNVDHHWAEALVASGSVYLGMRALELRTRSSGIALGAVLGLGIGVHNALFLWQAIFVGCSAWLALTRVRDAVSADVAGGFAVGLIAGTLAILIPSEPFRAGAFTHYLASCFHLYVACASSLVVLLVARSRRRGQVCAVVFVVAPILVLPLFRQVLHGASYVAGDLGLVGDVDEVKSVFSMVSANPETFLRQFGALALFAPVAAFGAWSVFRARGAPGLLFAAGFALALVLFAAQVRFWYFSAALLPVALFAGLDRLRSTPQVRPAVANGVLIAMVLTVAASTVGAHTRQLPLGGSATYAMMAPLFPRLAAACAASPGLALANQNLGHYITYHTECSVLANNFLMTDLQMRKVVEARALAALTPSELRNAGALPRYVLTYIDPAKVAQIEAGGRVVSASPQVQAFLVADAPPPGYRILEEVIRVNAHGRPIRIARLMEIMPQSSSDHRSRPIE